MCKGIVLVILLLPLMNAEDQRHRRTFNKEHIKEDIRHMMPEEELNVELDDTDAMDFHYFKLHDYDNNNRLDGLELARMEHVISPAYELIFRAKLHLPIRLWVDRRESGPKRIKAHDMECCDHPGAAMTHYHEGGEPGGRKRKVDVSDEELANLVKQVLKDDDLNDDGYVDYYEFVRSQRQQQDNL